MVPNGRALILAAELQKIPVDWVWARLEDVCSGIFDCPHSTPTLAAVGPLLARSQDIRSGIFRSDLAAHVSEETYLERTRRAEPRFGDLLYSREGTYFGIAAEVPRGERVCLGQRMVLVRPDSGRMNSKFLLYWLNSSFLSAHIYGHRDGSVAERLNLPTIRRIPVVVPPLSVQQSIVEILGAVDEKIEVNRRINGTLETMARALFKAWFVDFEPVCNGTSWRAKAQRLDDLASLEKRVMVPEDFSDEAFDHYSIPAFDEGKLAKREIGENIKSNKFLVPPGSILLSKLNPRIPRVWLPSVSAEVRSICSTEFLVVVPREEVDREYLYSIFSSAGFADEFSSRATGTSGSHQRVRPEDLLRIEVEVPEKGAREAYSEVVGPVLAKVAQNLDESRTLAALRDTLLPKLLSGEIRVKQAEKIVEEAL